MNFRLENKVVNSFAQCASGPDDDATDNGHYVFEIERTLDGSSFVSSMSDKTLTLSNAEDLRTIGKVKAHGGSDFDTINRIECSKVSPHLIVSAADDKTVRGWDTRCFERPVFNIQHSEAVSAVSVGLNGSLLASSCESTVFFHDVRFFGSGSSGTPGLLGSYLDAHSDTITQLKFHPTQSHILASASEDHLICTFDTAITAMEDSVVSTFNTESPVARFNYFGENHDAIYALSGNETLSFWHHPSAQRVAEFTNIREGLGVDYLVDCFGPANSNDIYLLAGTFDGKGVVAQMLPTGFNKLGSVEGGHTAQIRCSSAAFAVTAEGAPAVRLTTGGEDARLCKWTTVPSTVPSSFHPTQAHSSGALSSGHRAQGAPKSGGNMKVKKDNSLRSKPY